MQRMSLSNNIIMKNVIESIHFLIIMLETYVLYYYTTYIYFYNSRAVPSGKIAFLDVSNHVSDTNFWSAKCFLLKILNGI